MKKYNNAKELREAAACLSVAGGKVTVKDANGLKKFAEELAYNAALGANDEVKGYARWLAHEAALAAGVVPSSIHDLYMARGRNEYKGKTVPAINLRGLTFDSSRAIFRAARSCDAAAMLFEIARSEISYTAQRPAEYASQVLCAALAEGYRGPVFLQGDHFQFNAKKFAEKPDNEKQLIRDLIREAVEAGFYNIDIDSSTLVDLSKPTIMEQQYFNYALCAEMTAYIRSLEPPGVTVSVGGEIGEVGKQNSTVEELTAFMNGYQAELKKKGAFKGISKISIQTGTSHGGVPLPDGTIATVKLDFDCLENLGRVARDKYGLSGSVQHGASTLPDDAFGHFTKREAAEVHLATGFQNIILDHAALPAALRGEITNWVAKECAGERSSKDTEEQFIYKARKKAFGPFKEKLWGLPPDVRGAIAKTLEEKFVFLFQKLNNLGTRALVEKYVEPVAVSLPAPKIQAERYEKEVTGE